MKVVVVVVDWAEKRGLRQNIHRLQRRSHFVFSPKYHMTNATQTQKKETVSFHSASKALLNDALQKSIM